MKLCVNLRSLHNVLCCRPVNCYSHNSQACLGYGGFLSGRTELMQGQQYIQDYFQLIITLCQNVTKEFPNVLMLSFHT